MEVRHPLSQLFGVSFQQGIDSALTLSLHKGQIVKTRVLETYSSERAVLLLKGRKVTARTHVPLTKGSVVAFKVQKVFPTPILTIIETHLADSESVNGSAIRAAIKQNLWKAGLEAMLLYGHAAEDSAAFRKLVLSLSMRLFVTSPPELLKLLIDQSGFRWEAKLREALRRNMISRDNLNKLAARDLKGLCSKFIAFEEKENGPLRRLFSTIQDIQLLNKVGLSQRRMMFFPIPFQFPDGLHTVGQLLIRLPPREEGGQKQPRKDGTMLFSVAFLLELSRLGPLRADLSLKGKDIWGRILLSTEKARLYMENAIPGFIASMTEMGFSVHSLECRCTEPEIVTRTLLAEILQPDCNAISLVA